MPKVSALIATSPPNARRAWSKSAKGANRTRDTALFRRVLYQLSYLGVGRAHRFRRDALDHNLATLMGLEPTTFAVTGRRSNQLSYSAKAGNRRLVVGTAGFEPATP